ncbi:uncharacterized protein LOC142983038 isoform X2 [Anticarsia gemmatalis]|uniref:uncharacterized protein LOC142983038 isoform X2 n=1 Tax=Anticarsia gemmatalis TaxID=129554 RepID=UPI003F767402
MIGNTANIIVHVLIAVNIRVSQSCPQGELGDVKAAYKSGEINDQTGPITLDKIKSKLKQSEIFDWQDPTLTDREKKEMGKLFDAVELMTTSRSRQPANVQTLFSSLRLVERVVKKQLKEGQISETLAAKFDWDKLHRSRRDKPSYLLDKTTNMRMFNTNKNTIV